MNIFCFAIFTQSSYFYCVTEFCPLERPGQTVKYIREGYKKRVSSSLKSQRVSLTTTKFIDVPTLKLLLQ